jgi:hypothetical protein
VVPTDGGGGKKHSITLGEELFKEIHDITDESCRRVILTSKNVNTMEMDFQILELIPGEENVIVWIQ